MVVKEEERLRKLFEFEKRLRERGYKLIAGVDEAGRGPLAGPVVAAAVILPENVFIPNLKDSKLLSEKKREEVYEEIVKKAITYSFSIVDERYIDMHNILKATLLAMKNAVLGLKISPDYIIVDALKIPEIDLPQEGIKGGDRICGSIAAASIVAKVERDRIMKQYHDLYPQYDFLHNKGYGTKKHIESIKKFGYSPIHRKTFSIKNLEM
ncbi:ribonuclease HII [Thermovenabulum gondwanense]|uniref:Ribonuclease HII n=1 Tax=Thermovenabulum gondwanense TaxID=520767 RepID=A0A162MNK2_9FIRM|nr:ribonuclease HII [Thermovenabulum gondwanense]KYO66793.1 Ribonuclease HII [Thermovenabulum gondwanense]